MNTPDKKPIVDIDFDNFIESVENRQNEIDQMTTEEKKIIFDQSKSLFDRMQSEADSVIND